MYVLALSLLVVCRLTAGNGNENLNTETRSLLDVYYDEKTVICANKICATGERCGFDGLEAKCIPISGTVDNRKTNNNRLSRAPRTRILSKLSSLARPPRTLGINYRGQNNLSERPRSKCDQPGDRGRCTIPRPKIDRYYYSQRQGKCVKFAYSGCGGNTNNFKIYKDCFDECILPKLSAVSQNRNTAQLGSRQNSGSLLSMNNNRRISGDVINGKLGGSLLLLAPVSSHTQVRGGFASGAAMLGHPIPSQKCIMRLEKGTTCTGAMRRRWYFNIRTSRCEDFIYTGCGGNANNFMTLDECNAACDYNSQTSPRIQRPARRPISSGWSTGAAIEPPSFCLQHPKQGNCESEYIRYYYNKIKGTCEPFHYSGCDGNENRFTTEGECIQFCVMEGPNKISDSNAATNEESTTNEVSTTMPVLPSHPPPVEVSHTGTVHPLPAHCNLDYDAGPCGALLPRYYYNNVTKRCETFLYGGCMGNGNKFESIDACDRDCNYHDSLVRINVELPMKAPLTHKKDVKNSSKKLTNSKIVTQLETTTIPMVETTMRQDIVVSSPPDLCYLPAQTGCSAQFTRFFYNSQTGQCESFQYGGCRPNKNNFKTIMDCQKVCMHESSQFVIADSQISNSNPSSVVNLNQQEYISNVNTLFNYMFN